jgi:integrase
VGNKITQKGFEKLLRDAEQKPHNLGDKLYLVIRDQSRDFYFRYTLNGKTRKYSLKPYNFKTNTLADARREATRLNGLLLQGIDPHEQRDKEKASKQAEKQKRAVLQQSKANTFAKVAEELIEDRASQWSNAKSRPTWENTLKTYAYPVIGDRPIAEITKAEIVSILKPIWHTKYETARKLRQRIEAVFSRAIFYDLRKTANPASYKDNLENILPKPRQRQIKHHPALNYKQLPAFMSELKLMPGFGARALMFLILNAARTTEVRKAKWDEFDFEKGLWVIPVEEGRLGKTKKPHVVPLSTQSLDLIKALYDERISHYVFPNTRSTSHLSEAGMDAVLKRMQKQTDWTDDFGNNITVHGFRSTMRDFIAEQTDFEAETAETVLAHNAGSKVEKAYRRGDLLEKRRRLMQYYSDYAFG